MLDEIMGLVFLPTRSAGWCGLGVTTMTVDVNGEVLPCYTLLHDSRTWQMGTVTAEGIVAAKRVDEIKAILADAGRGSVNYCSNCDIRDSCRGCPGGVFATNGEFTAIDPIGCAFRIGAVEGMLNGWM